MNNIEKRIIELSNDGNSIEEIAKAIGKTESTVYMYLRRHKENTGRAWMKSERKLGQAITQRMIDHVRRKTQIGTTIMIESMKTASIDNGKTMGTRVRVRIIGKKKHFCVTQLPGGCLECVLWVDLL